MHITITHNNLEHKPLEKREILDWRTNFRTAIDVLKMACWESLMIPNCIPL